MLPLSRWTDLISAIRSTVSRISENFQDMISIIPSESLALSEAKRIEESIIGSAVAGNGNIKRCLDFARRDRRRALQNVGARQSTEGDK
jgi:hypothetical protein